MQSVDEKKIKSKSLKLRRWVCARSASRRVLRCICETVVYWVSLRLFRFLVTIKATGDGDAAFNNSLESHWKFAHETFWLCALVDDETLSTSSTRSFLWQNQRICFVCAPPTVGCVTETKPIMEEWHIRTVEAERKQKAAAIQRWNSLFADLLELLRKQKKIGLFVWWNRQPRVSCQSIWPRQYTFWFDVFCF